MNPPYTFQQKCRKSWDLKIQKDCSGEEEAGGDRELVSVTAKSAIRLNKMSKTGEDLLRTDPRQTASLERSS
jgi:hypothetical protein